MKSTFFHRLVVPAAAMLCILAGAIRVLASPPVSINGDQGGIVGFATTERTCLDNTSGFLDSVGLYAYDGAPLKALQFRIRNANGKIRITGVQLDPLLAQDPRWLCMWEIKRSSILPDLGTNDTVSVVILGQEDAELMAGIQHGLVRFTYDAVDIGSAGDNSTVLEIYDVIGSLAGGVDAMLTAGSGQTLALTNTVQKGDVNYDDDVNINDLLDVMHVILGKSTYSGETFTRADIAPWPAGDGTIDVKDLAMTQQIILDGQYPNGTRLRIQGQTADSHARAVAFNAPKAKVTVYITKKGVEVRLENTVNVKGIQLELSNIPIVPDTAKVNTIWGPGSKGFSNNILRIIAADLSGASVVTPGDRIVIEMNFDIGNPLQVSFHKLIVADESNGAVTDIEASIVYGSPNPVEEVRTLPTYELSQNYPNPFNPTTRIQFHLPSGGNIRLVVYNLLGEEIRTLYSGYAEAGRHVVNWDATSESGEHLPSGVYVYTLYTASTRFTRKMMYMQ
ncbi:MAG: T9SS type A sorting domain-containing protein [Bacteroidetes bacterium]|nr:T9SS type A sorting domain-containing protein [Bacteroidota bacterium]